MPHHETPLPFARPSRKASTGRVAMLMAISMAGCASVEETPADEWTAEDEAAYQQCLQDNMAVAMAWEMIEQSCRDEVKGNDGRPPLE